jgi:hypothetical protein
MATITYYSGATELKNVYALPVARFKAIGGVFSKHNTYDSFKRMVGHPVNGPDALLPVTRTIEYKSNPSKHKCSDRCRNATGHVCECECGGKFHGVNN